MAFAGIQHGLFLLDLRDGEAWNDMGERVRQNKIVTEMLLRIVHIGLKQIKMHI